jgi:sulfate adenylyltransferase subunit 2
MRTRLTHLQRLEAESVHIFREVIAQVRRPVMLYSMGKDSAVMLHLAKKAFYPEAPPFPLLHIDTNWKFKAMYDMRDHIARTSGMEMIVHKNPDGVSGHINPFDHGSAHHTQIWKTEGLKQALRLHGFDAAFGGARRDEEKSRAKERICSFRDANQRWDPRTQRPEVWNLFNLAMASDHSVRVFPLSNWTELDIWTYIAQENIEIVPLYFSAMRPVVVRSGGWLMVDDERFVFAPGEVATQQMVRFRTLGCYPLSGAIRSSAKNVADIVAETRISLQSERQGRLIDFDDTASMERKKQDGYF